MADVVQLIALYPVRVEIVYNDTPIRVESTEYGDDPVYIIHGLQYRNETGMPYQFRMQDDVGHDVSRTIAAAAEGDVNIPTPQRPETWGFSYSIMLIR